MEKKWQNVLLVIFALALAGAISVYIYSDLTKPAPDIANEDSVNLGQPGFTLDAESQSQNYKIEVLDNKTDKMAETGAKMPDLSRKVVNYGKINEPSFENAAKNIADLTKGLQAEPKSEPKWLDLAAFRKMVGDYEGAVEILNYIAVLWPNHYVPFNNLADLYQFYLKNYPLAEKNWLKVIEIRPDYIDAYTNLYALYNDSYQGQKEKALPILLKGLQNNPESITLMVYIARHYRSAGEKTQADFYYNQAIKEAEEQNNSEAAESLRAEASEINTK